MELSSQMMLFARVVDAGSFSAAARELDLSPSAVSKRIGGLEDQLGIRLLSRSRRGIDLTDEGIIFYQRCVEIRRHVAGALDLVDSLSEHPKGRLSVTTTVAFGKSQVLPMLPGFLERYPEIEIALEFNDRPVDASRNDFDVAIQFAEQIEDESLIARKLAPNRRVICAAPAYLARHGRPATPEDLARHNLLRLSTVDRWNRWIDELQKGARPAAQKSNFTANSADAIYYATLAGIGIARLPTYLVARDLAEGRLVKLMNGYEDDATSIYAVYLMKRNMSPRVRAFINYLASAFGSEPPWEHAERARERSHA